jgi:hypothetical protein
MDYFLEYDSEVFERLYDAGVRDVITLEVWERLEPEPGRLALDRYVEYLQKAKAAGIRILVAESGAPSWMPDAWHLKNGADQYNVCRELLQQEAAQPSCHICLGWGSISSLTWLSYWNPEAEAATQAHITAMRAITEAEGSTLMPWIGIGEYLFPPACFIPLQPWSFSEWWFDDFAVQSWTQYREEVKSPTRAGWVYREQVRITKSRLALYTEKWLQPVPYWHDLRFGTNNTNGILAQNAADLKTILFTVFVRPEWQQIARKQAKKYPTWCGCEGPFNLVENARKAKKLGMQGVICGILWPSYGLTKMAPWVYEAIKQAISDWSTGT